MFQHFCPYRAQAPRHIIPRVSLRLPWAEEVIGLSARLGLTGLCATIVFSARLGLAFDTCLRLLLVHYPAFSESLSCFCWFIILYSQNHLPAFFISLSCFCRPLFPFFPPSIWDQCPCGMLRPLHIRHMVRMIVQCHPKSIKTRPKWAFLALRGFLFATFLQEARRVCNV